MTSWRFNIDPVNLADWDAGNPANAERIARHAKVARQYTRSRLPMRLESVVLGVGRSGVVTFTDDDPERPAVDEHHRYFDRDD